MQQRSPTLYSSHINALTLCQPIIWKGKVQLSFQIWYITLTTKSTSNHIRRKLSLSAMVDGQPCIDSSSSSNSGRVAAAVAVGRRESQWMGGRKRGRWSRETANKSVVHHRASQTPVVTKHFLGKEPVENSAQFPEELIQCERHLNKKLCPAQHSKLHLK